MLEFVQNIQIFVNAAIFFLMVCWKLNLVCLTSNSLRTDDLITDITFPCCLFTVHDVQCVVVSKMVLLSKMDYCVKKNCTIIIQLHAVFIQVYGRSGYAILSHNELHAALFIPVLQK